MLVLRHLSKSYPGHAGRRSVLQRLDYTLGTGEYVAIMGDSGVGKSTLLNLIAGLDPPDSGDILVEGRPMSALDDDAATRLRREKFGFIFQAFHVLPQLNLLQNVSLPLLLQERGGTLAGHQARAREMLAAVGLQGREADLPRQLSGGELQRVAIARALVHRPALLLADEPTGNLDPETASHVLALLRTELKANGASGILVTHSAAAAATADRILLLTAQGLQPLDRDSARLSGLDGGLPSDPP